MTRSIAFDMTGDVHSFHVALLISPDSGVPLRRDTNAKCGWRLDIDDQMPQIADVYEKEFF
jgi:hypothetical protein